AGGVWVMVIDGAEVGSLRVDDRGHELFLASIELVPAFQRRGLGGEIVRSILEDARRRRIPVRLQVFRQNRARRLYERLGYRAVGETTTHVEMLHGGDMPTTKLWKTPDVVPTI